MRKKKEKLKLSDPENPGPIQLASPGEHVHITLSLLLKKLKLSKKKCEKYFLSDSQKKKVRKTVSDFKKECQKKDFCTKKQATKESAKNFCPIKKRQKKKVSVFRKKGKKITRKIISVRFKKIRRLCQKKNQDRKKVQKKILVD